MPFDITVLRSSCGTIIVAPGGDIDIAAAPRLREELAAALTRQPPRAVICDLSDVQFIDAVGLGVLAAASQRAQEGGRGFTVAGARGHVRRTLEMVALPALIDASSQRPGHRLPGARQACPEPVPSEMRARPVGGR